MSFKLTIEVPDSKLISTLRQLTGHKVMVEGFGISGIIPAGTLKKSNGDARPHTRAESHLTMTGKTPKVGSKIEPAVEIFEKLEKRMGIGMVNVAAFRIALERKNLSKGLAQRCVTEKFMAYL